MKSRLFVFVAGVAFLGYGIIDPTPANAADKYAHNSGDWSGDNIWYTEPCDEEPGEDAGEPSASEDATICPDVVVTVCNALGVAKTVTLEGPSNPTGSTRIDIDPEAADATLTLGSGESPLTSTLNSNTKIRLRAHASNIATLRFVAANHTVARVNGSGDIVGYDDDARIVIDGVALTSQVNIKGCLDIMDGTSAGSFINQGSVIANASGTLDIAVTTIDDTAGSGRWRVRIWSTAVLRFLEEPDCLDGDFVVSTGTLRAGGDGGDDIDVVTTGDLTQTGGQIEAGVDDSFCFKCSCP